MRGASTAFALALVLALASAGGALAAPQFPRGYTEGGLDSAIGTNCTSITLGDPRLETQVTAGAAAQTSKRKPSRVGRVFYVRARVGTVGVTCSGAIVTIEVIPPRGVTLAVSRRYPLWFDYPQFGSPPEPSNGRDLVRKSRGRFGGTAFNAFFDGETQPIPLSNDDGPVELHVPLAARRSLKGTAARRPRCRGQGDEPCSRRRARDHVQVAVEVGAAVAPTLLVAEAGLFARGR